MSIDRRRVLNGALAGFAALLLAAPGARASMREKTQAISATAIAPGEPTKPYPFELFYDLSRYLTVRVDLDRDLARDYFEHFNREEWGWTNAAKLYAILRRELASGTSSAPELLMSKSLSEFDQWFAEHMLDAWYDGFYRYDGQEVRLTYEKAFMWDAVSDFLPVQGLSAAAYGYWAVAPQLRDNE